MDELLLRMALAVVLMILVLYLAVGFLAVPMGILRRSGVLRAVRWVLRTSRRGIRGVWQLLRSRRRRRIRRPLGGAFIRLFR